MSSGPSTKKVDPRDKLIFDLVRERYNQELSRINDLDGKAGNLIGFVGIITSFVLGIGSLSFVQEQKPDAWLVAIFLLGVLFLMGSMVLGLLAYRVRRWEVVPKVKVLIEKYTTEMYDVVLKSVGATTSETVEKIAKQNDDKADYINAAWWFLIIGLTTVLIYTAIRILPPS